MTRPKLRLGRFSIAMPIIYNAPHAARAILADCIVLHADPRLDIDAIEYVAIHPAFPEVDHGTRAPEYRAIIGPEGVVWEPVP